MRVERGEQQCRVLALTHLHGEVGVLGVGEAVHRRHVERPPEDLGDDVHLTYGSDGLPIGSGDVIQTRRNDSELGVANRQTWTVRHVSDDGEVWARESGTGREHRRSVGLGADYVAEHTHLAYATTSYGVQSATTPAAHRLLSDALDGAGMYVGMTRGQHRNTLHVVAADLDEAREQFTTALQRDRADRGLADATRAARDAVSGLVPSGAVAFVNAERARLREWLEAAEPEAARWEHAADALTRQSATYATEYERQAHVVATADAAIPLVGAEVTAPLVAQATTDATAYLSAEKRMWQADGALRASGRFGRRAAARTLSEATEAHHAAEDAMRQRWDDVPHPWGNTEAWARAAAERRADADPRVVDARQDATRAAQRLHDLTAHHADSRAAPCRLVGNGQRPSTVQNSAAEWRSAADLASRSLAEIEALPVSEAAQLIRDRAAHAAAGRAAEAARLARAAERSLWHSPSPVYPSNPARDSGLSR